MSTAALDASPVTLRRMRWWDIAAAAALEAELFPVDAWTAETFWSELGQGQTRHYVVAVAGSGADERIAGYAGLLAPGGESDVQTLAVSPDFQRRGIGRLLLDALVAEAMRRGSPALLLEVRADNPAAQRLYASAGFEQIAVRRGYYSPGAIDALVMRRRLAGGSAGGSTDGSTGGSTGGSTDKAVSA